MGKKPHHMFLHHSPNRSAMLAGAAALAMAASPATAAIVIVNPSFELNDIANGTASANGFHTAGGWTGGTTFLVDNNTTQNQWFNQAVPDGQQAASLANNFFTQPLNDNVTGAVMTSTVAQQFDISFFAGRRKESAAVGSFSVILQAYNGGAYVGDLAVQRFNTGGDDANSATIDLGLGQGNWTSSAISLSLTAPANLHAGNNIRLVFAQNTPFGSGGTGEAAIDNVSVTAVPEPSIALLGGLGLLALLRRRR